uniref:ATP synthase peripheral stalk subunit OSCP, mitochondrial n=1 Tax=Mesenchytraeus antaeus TaxID=1797136 RepID=A0A286Q4X3_9ANNE|nr:mitochondrial ATP synthase subunit OSCP-like precursor [Mesenchytraeus antaeus]
MATRRLGTSLIRQFTTSVAGRAKLVPPPIHLFGIEGRYAHALYSAASKEKKLEIVEKEIKEIQSTLKTDVKLREFMTNPVVKRSDKRDTLQLTFKKKNYANVTVNLLAALAENGRLNKLNGVFNAFDKLMSAHRGEVICVVTTAKPLEQGHLKELRTALEAFLKKGEVLQLETKVDPSIIGGMVVNIGDRYVDMSTATKIKTYTNLIQEAV